MTPLPFAQIVRQSYADLLAHQDGLVRIGWVWLLVPLTLDGIARVLGGAAASLSLAALFISFIGLAAIAVAWHRHVIDRRPLQGPMAPVDSVVLRYLALGILISLITSVPTALGAGIAVALIGGGEGRGMLDTLVLVATIVVAIVLFTRMQLIFPAVATGDATMGLAASWRRTRGQTLRLAIGMLLTVLPVIGAMLLALLASILFEAIGAPRFGAFVALVANHAGGWVQAPLVAAFLSYSYLWFKQQPAPPAG